MFSQRYNEWINYKEINEEIKNELITLIDGDVVIKESHNTKQYNTIDIMFMEEMLDK